MIVRSVKYTNKDRTKAYWYEAVPMVRDGYWCVQKVTDSVETGTYVHPVADWLSQDEAESAVLSGSPLRYLGEWGRRRSPRD